jgi:hypothetical protein
VQVPLRMQQQQQQQQQQPSYGYFMSSVASSLAPSARSSPPLYPEPQPHLLSMPSLDGGMIFGQMPQAAVYNLPQSVPQYAQHPMGYGWIPTQQQILYPSNQMQVPLSNQRQSVPLSFDSSIPQGLQGYAPLLSYQAGAGSYAQQPQYHPPHSGLATPYNEPRTPYNEPLSPAIELSHWGERQV